MDTSRVRITQVETHVTHMCNFTCESCTHFSNEGYTGRETPDSFLAKVSPWASRLHPQNLLLLGGEPTLNPDLCEILEISRALWPLKEHPQVKIMLVTNGWFLKRHPRLPGVLKDNHIHLDVSIHHDSPEYLAKLREIKQIASEWGVPIRWRESFRDWTRAYKGCGRTAEPYEDHKPQASWEACASKWCMTLHEGKLFKCPPITWLPMHIAKYGDANGKWSQYLKYTPLSPGCTQAELLEFIKRKCEPDICSMCPAQPEEFSKPSPLHRVSLL